MSFDFDLTAPFVAAFSLRDQYEQRHKVRPVQIVSASSTSVSSRYRFNESGLQSVLGHSIIANKKIVVLSIGGWSRSGKSFLLNCFLDYLYNLQKSIQNEMLLSWMIDETNIEGTTGWFSWKTGPKRDTQGIWVWGQPIVITLASGETVAVLLMDVQGVDEDGGQVLEMLAALTSSVHIVNVTEQLLKESTLTELQPLLNYALLAAKESPPEFGKPLQSIVFAVRDFRATEKTAVGHDNALDYLTERLQGGDDDDAYENWNQCVSSLDAWLVPHPGSKCAESAAYRGQVKELRALFREEVRRLVSTLLDPQTMRPKTVFARPISCKKYIHFFREIARACCAVDDSIGGGGLPSPVSILAAHARLLCQEAAQEAKAVYAKTMDRSVAGARPLSTRRLQEAHITAGVTAINLFERWPRFGGARSNEQRSRQLAILQEDVNAELERYKSANEAKRVTGCASAALACGDSALLGVGIASSAAATGTAAVLAISAGASPLGVAAVPVALLSLFSIWLYVALTPPPPLPPAQAPPTSVVTGHSLAESSSSPSRRSCGALLRAALLHTTTGTAPPEHNNAADRSEIVTTSRSQTLPRQYRRAQQPQAAQQQQQPFLQNSHADDDDEAAVATTSRS